MQIDSAQIWSLAVSFLIGSVPTAFLLIRRSLSRDLRREGSGNIGALNAYEVSGSKYLGLSVLLIDLVKGALPLLTVPLVFGSAAGVREAAFTGVVLGHNFSPWIGFKGGRGLASAAGASLIYDIGFIVVWGAFWLASFAVTRRVIVSNIIASLLAIPAIVSLALFGWPVQALHLQDWPHAITGSIVCVLILMGHRKVFSEWMKRR
jgi:glycerol-3-phosphate acyltransferase PlsY